MFKNITTSVLLAALILVPSMTAADDTVPLSYPPKVATMLLASSLSAQMGVDPYQVKYVLKHESGYSQDAVGDHGLAVGVGQYHKDTFNHYEKLYFNTTGTHLNYYTAQDQVRLMTWQWKVFPKSKYEWTTWRDKFGKIEL